MILVFVFGLGLLLRIGCHVLVLLGLHVVCVHVHLKNYSGTVESSGLLLKLHALVSVKSQVDLLTCNVRAMKCNVMFTFSVGDTTQTVYN